MNDQIGHWINGRAVAGESVREGDVLNPATGDVRARIALANIKEAFIAVDVALAASRDWAALPAAKRVQVLYRFRELLLEHIDELARMISSEHGKTLADARGEVSRGIEVVEFACGAPHLLGGAFNETVSANVDCFNMRQPVGVCAGITPFNFPVMVPLWMFPLAIACGNTFVLKPSERAPSAPLRLAEFLKMAGLPDGVFNIINGDKEVVDALLRHPEVGAVSFVGSTSVGRYVYETGCGFGKRVQALCGAKNHMVVMPDADMKQVADAAIGAAYGSAGERCMAISVVVTVGDVTGDEFIRNVAPRVSAVRVGPYMDSTSQMGPIVTGEARDRIRDYIEKGIEQGAKLIVDGRNIQFEGYENGFFLGGCLFDRVTPEMDIYKDEIFGPVLSVVRVKSYEEAISLVDNHRYGNGTAIFTRDGDTARDFAQRTRTGMVGINVPIPVPVAYHSFGGWKGSFFGDHAIHGMEGIRFYTKIKTVTARWPSGVRAGPQFHFRRGTEI